MEAEDKEGKGDKENAFTEKAMQEASGGQYPRSANYSFDYGNAHWTVLDSNYYTNWNSKEMQTWLENDLPSNRSQTHRRQLSQKSPGKSGHLRLLHLRHRNRPNPRILPIRTVQTQISHQLQILQTHLIQHPMHSLMNLLTPIIGRQSNLGMHFQLRISVLLPLSTRMLLQYPRLKTQRKSMVRHKLKNQLRWLFQKNTLKLSSLNRPTILR